MTKWEEIKKLLEKSEIENNSSIYYSFSILIIRLRIKIIIESICF